MSRACVGLLAAAVLGGCSPAPERVVAPSPEVSASPDRHLRDPVFVYQLAQSADGYDRRAYVALPRPSRGARGPGERLRVALDELAEGPTARERRAGYTSAFDESTADVIRRATLRGRTAVVDFHDFRRERGQWSTSYGGSVFLIQLTRTIFRSRRVQSILFRIDGSCRRFWTFLQAGRCEVVRRGR